MTKPVRRPFMRQALDALLPEGSAWKPAPGGGMDRILGGISACLQEVFEDLGSLENIRNPLECPPFMLGDLEKEFGAETNPAVPEEERRLRLAARCRRRPSLPSAAKLQAALEEAGFPLAVMQNSPAQDPSLFTELSFEAGAGTFPSESCSGNASVFCSGGARGYFLVSGDYFTQRPLYPQAGLFCCRGSGAGGLECSGYYETTVEENEKGKDLRPPEAFRPLVFFIGGKVERNGEGKITSIAQAEIPLKRRQELHRIVLRVKPLGTWAAVIARWV